MKVYVSADLEGVAGVATLDDTLPGGTGYAAACAAMTGEVNAVVEGAARAGATHVVVNDAHASMTNLVPEDVDQRAALIRGPGKPHSMVEGLDASFDAIVLLGYHARAGEFCAVRCHTFSGQVHELALDGAPVGELGLVARVAAHHGVPIVLVSGDDATAREVPPGVRTVVTKRAIGQTSAVMRSPRSVREELMTATSEELARRLRRAEAVVAPVVLEVAWTRTAVASACALVPGVDLVDGRRVRVTCDDAVQALERFVLMSFVASGVA